MEEAPQSLSPRPRPDAQGRAEERVRCKSREATKGSEAEKARDEAKTAEREGTKDLYRNTTSSPGYWKAMHTVPNSAYEVTDG